LSRILEVSMRYGRYARGVRMSLLLTNKKYN